MRAVGAGLDHRDALHRLAVGRLAPARGERVGRAPCGAGIKAELLVDEVVEKRDVALVARYGAGLRALRHGLLPGKRQAAEVSRRVGDRAGRPAPHPATRTRELRPRFEVSVADCEDLDTFRPLCTTDELFDLAAPDRMPDFAGKARYAFAADFSADDLASDWTLDLGRVGQTARLFVNGADAGIRVAPPYRFSLRGRLVAGRNEFVVETASTLARKLKDDLSFFLPIPPEGLLGPIRLQS